MEQESENNGKHFATYKNRKNIEDHLCDVITDVIFFMCIDAILGCDIFEKKKRSIRCDFDAIAIPDLNLLHCLNFLTTYISNLLRITPFLSPPTSTIVSPSTMFSIYESTMNHDWLSLNSLKQCCHCQVSIKF